MPAKTFNDLQKRIDDWTFEMLSDQDKMDAWVEERKILNKLDENGLLAKKERTRIIAEVNKKKRLDELFGVK
jgi:predicted transcriptional regulator YheO